MHYDHMLRIVTSLQYVVAVCANVMLAYLIIYRSNGHVKSHKEILLITSVHSAIFSAVMLVLQPVVLVGDGHIIAFSNGPLRGSSKHVSYASAVALFTALDVTVVCIAVQMIAACPPPFTSVIPVVACCICVLVGSSPRAISAYATTLLTSITLINPFTTIICIRPYRNDVRDAVLAWTSNVRSQCKYGRAVRVAGQRDVPGSDHYFSAPE